MFCKVVLQKLLLNCSSSFIVLKELRLCPTSQWECGDGHCLRAEMRCDRVVQCKDGSDEMHCGMVFKNFFFFFVIFMTDLWKKNSVKNIIFEIFQFFIY